MLSMIILATKEVNFMSIDKIWRVYLLKKEKWLVRKKRSKVKMSYYIQKIKISSHNDYLTMLSYKYNNQSQRFFIKFT